MANERFPEDPFRPRLSEDELTRATRQDSELQPDLELEEGTASNVRIALFSIAIALVLGAVFYGLNNSSIHQAGTAPPAQTAQTQPANPSSPAANNKQPGMTTGAAPSRPSEPQSAPKGTEVDRAATPPSNNGANKP